VIGPTSAPHSASRDPEALRTRSGNRDQPPCTGSSRRQGQLLDAFSRTKTDAKFASRRQTPNLTPFLRVRDAQTTSDVANARCSRAFATERKNSAKSATCWLGRQDSNLRMPEFANQWIGARFDCSKWHRRSRMAGDNQNENGAGGRLTKGGRSPTEVGLLPGSAFSPGDQRRVAVGAAGRSADHDVAVGRHFKL
jgi:hypothetical protein